MKKNKFLGILLSAIALFSSCDNDHDGPIIYLGMGTIDKPAQTYTVTFDNDLVAAIPDSSLLAISGSNKIGQRVIVSFHKIDDQNQEAGIYLHSILPVLTKPFFYQPTGLQSDSLGYDPVNISSAWIGGHHLNVEFTYRGGAYTNIPHFINMVDKGLQTPEGISKLQFRHNANGDHSNLLFSGYVSFPLPDNAAEEYVVTYKGLDMETHEFKVVKKNSEATFDNGYNKRTTYK